MTNYKQIKQMDIEQMADLFGNIFDCSANCEDCLIKKSGCCGYPGLDCCESAMKWLESEVSK